MMTIPKSHKELAELVWGTEFPIYRVRSQRILEQFNDTSPKCVAARKLLELNMVDMNNYPTIVIPTLEALDESFTWNDDTIYSVSYYVEVATGVLSTARKINADLVTLDEAIYCATDGPTYLDIEEKTRSEDQMLPELVLLDSMPELSRLRGLDGDVLLSELLENS